MPRVRPGARDLSDEPGNDRESVRAGDCGAAGRPDGRRDLPEGPVPPGPASGAGDVARAPRGPHALNTRAPRGQCNSRNSVRSAAGCRGRLPAERPGAGVGGLSASDVRTDGTGLRADPPRAIASIVEPSRVSSSLKRRRGPVQTAASASPRSRWIWTISPDTRNASPWRRPSAGQSRRPSCGPKSQSARQSVPTAIASGRRCGCSL